MCGRVRSEVPLKQIPAADMTIVIPWFEGRPSNPIPKASLKEEPVMDLHLQPDWGRLLGQHVEVRLNGTFLRSGVVDTVMPDNSILWLAAEGPWSRGMVEKTDHKDVYARYEWNVQGNSMSQ